MMIPRTSLAVPNDGARPLVTFGELRMITGRETTQTQTIWPAMTARDELRTYFDVRRCTNQPKILPNDDVSPARLQDRLKTVKRTEELEEVRSNIVEAGVAPGLQNTEKEKTLRTATLSAARH